MLKLLRYAWMAFFVLLMFAVCLFWVKNRKNGDVHHFRTGTWIVAAGSAPGMVIFMANWKFEMGDQWVWNIDNPRQPRFFFRPHPGGFAVTSPHWFVALVLSVIAMLPWFSLRFSVRGLLILTTIAALVLARIMMS